MLEVTGSLQVSSIIPLQTDRRRNKINSTLKSILFFFSSLHTTSCMQTYHKREPKCFPLLLSLNVWGPGIGRASVKLDKKKMWHCNVKAIDLLNCSVSYVVLKYCNADHRFGNDPDGCKDCNSYEQKSNKAL
jgi:hypothetical protein